MPIDLKNYDPALMYGAVISDAGEIVTGTVNTTSTSATALAVGPAGTTNPSLLVDASTASAATGIKIKSAAAAAGVAMSVVSSGSAENLTIDAKGTGTITLGSVSTGNVILSSAVQQKANVISGQGATATLTAAQSGSVVLFDRAAGIVYTLPAPAVGMYFDFIVSTTITSNAAKVITDAGTTLVAGMLVGGVTTTATPFYGNGSTHIAVSMNGTTTGGIQGTQFRFTCVTSTLWNVTGLFEASGTIATPFSAT